MSLNLAHYLKLAAEANPDKTAVIWDDTRLTYSELLNRSNRIANLLRDIGIKKGDKIAMMIPNTPDFPAVYFGILSTGATVVPINVLLKAHEIQYHLEDSDAEAFFTWHEFYEDSRQAFLETDTCRHLVVVGGPEDRDEPPFGRLLEPLLREASPDFDPETTMPDDTAVLLYTSGTTGRPKGAELTHFNMFSNAYYVKERITYLRDDDIALAVLPLFHSFGQTCVMNATLMGAATMTLMVKFETPKILEVIQRDKVTVISAVPTMYYFILNDENAGSYDLSTIRMAVSGGSALPVEVLNQFEERFGIRILEGYGLSETSPVASFNIIERPSKAGSIGLPIWGCEMRVMREDGAFAEVGEVGEIVIRGHNVMKGYYKKPVATEEAVVNGWFHTGDLAHMDEEGYFFIVDRKKDLIIRSGMNIYPREIEEVLYGHPAVLEAAVIGVPDKARGEEVKGYVALKEGARVTQEELQAYCRERMAKFKVPREFEILPSLPKGPTGKILKRELRVGNARP